MSKETDLLCKKKCCTHCERYIPLLRVVLKVNNLCILMTQEHSKTSVYCKNRTWRKPMTFRISMSDVLPPLATLGHTQELNNHRTKITSQYSSHSHKVAHSVFALTHMHFDYIRDLLLSEHADKQEYGIFNFVNNIHEKLIQPCSSKV